MDSIAARKIFNSTRIQLEAQNSQNTSFYGSGSGAVGRKQCMRL